MSLDVPWQKIAEREASGRLDTWSECLCIRPSDNPQVIEIAVCRYEELGEMPSDWFDEEGRPLPPYSDEDGSLKLPEYYEYKFAGQTVRTQLMGHDGEYLLGPLTVDESSYGGPIAAHIADKTEIKQVLGSLGWVDNSGALAAKIQDSVAHRPYLDFYDDDCQARWNWKWPQGNFVELVSQEFISEEEAIEAWRNGKLIWEKPPSFE